ncbi:DUF4229 domain-containing protein [Nocardioides marmoraquaticus]
MKEFLHYTLLRFGLFLSTMAVFGGIGVLVFGEGSLIWALLLAVVVSAGLSYKLLARQREALALRVQQRAEAASARFEERKAREDVD